MLIICLFTLSHPRHSLRAQTLDTSVTLHYDHDTFRQILQDLEERYDLSFSYGRLDLERKLSFSYTGKLGSGIAALLKEQDLVYRQVGRRFALRPLPPWGRPVNGYVFDIQTRLPLLGATIQVLDTDPPLGAASDENGYFRLPILRVGRYDLLINYLGYETKEMKAVLVMTGKAAQIEIPMNPSSVDIPEIVVSRQYDPSRPLYHAATNSTRSFSIEETSRYAAAISDPARMAMAFAGVNSNGDDLSNEIIIRGNSSRGLIWRLEGVEIPNPNHFSDLGGTSGNISMLSASTLNNSDFLTGAFPAEFGNALSGVFDLNLRIGNTEKREHTVRLGTLGFEGSIEGPLKKGSKSSYLVNYRYSTIDLIERLIPDLPTQVDPFQDISFKVQLPTRHAGTFTIFGLGGKNATGEGMEADTSNFQFDWQLQEFITRQGTGVVGLKHQILLGKRSYLRTSISASTYRYKDETTQLEPSQQFTPAVIDVSTFHHDEIAFNSLFHLNFSESQSIRAGLNLRRKAYQYDYISVADADAIISLVESKGSTYYTDGFMQWQSNWQDRFTINVGLNISHLGLNDAYGIDPRIGIKYRPSEGKTWSLATGIYSKPDHISIYLIERKEIGSNTSYPNLDLPLLKAWHLVGAYDQKIKENTRIKLEAYYQYLYDIPSGVDSSVFSSLNASTLFDVIFLNNADGERLTAQGTGVNYGIEGTWEHFFAGGHYHLITGSLFESRFTTTDGRMFPTRYASKFSLNVLYGKEWNLGIGKKNTFGCNSRIVFNGGLRYTPLLEEASVKVGTGIFDESRYNALNLPNYFRLDLGLYWRINSEKITHKFSIDCQNITNRKNVAGRFFDPLSNRPAVFRQSGLIPFINYEIHF